MRVVTLQELGDLPSGTIFSMYDPCMVTGLHRLHSVIRCTYNSRYYREGEVTDFLYYDLLASPDITECYKEPGDDPSAGWSLGDCSRWGLFEMSALFLVYDRDDVAKMVKLLTAGEKEMDDCDHHAYEVWSKEHA